MSDNAKAILSSIFALASVIAMLVFIGSLAGDIVEAIKSNKCDRVVAQDKHQLTIIIRLDPAGESVRSGPVDPEERQQRGVTIHADKTTVERLTGGQGAQKGAYRLVIVEDAGQIGQAAKPLVRQELDQ